MSFAEKREAEARRLTQEARREIEGHPALRALFSEHGARLRDVKILREE